MATTVSVCVRACLLLKLPSVWFYGNHGWQPLLVCVCVRACLLLKLPSVILWQPLFVCVFACVFVAETSQYVILLTLCLRFCSFYLLQTDCWTATKSQASKTTPLLTWNRFCHCELASSTTCMN